MDWFAVLRELHGEQKQERKLREFRGLKGESAALDPSLCTAARDADPRQQYGHEEGERVLRHKGDEHYGTVCRFLNRKTRACTVYEGRPEACREFPGPGRCGYYDFLCFQRNAQEEPDFIPTTRNA